MMFACMMMICSVCI